MSNKPTGKAPADIKKLDWPAHAALAQHFRLLHTAPELLVLPNAWDAGSAVIFERAGFNAIGTTSAGISYSLGLPDGQRVALADLLWVQTHIINRISIPLSVDLEAGYGQTPEQVVTSVAQVISGGAVGINLEDGLAVTAPRLIDAELQCEVLKAVSEYRDASGIPFVINARTDSFWLGLGQPEQQLAFSIERGNAYLQAGADCVFVPGNLPHGTIDALVRELDGPLNVIAAPACPQPAELAELGVARLSVGSGPARAALETVRQIAADLRSGSLAGLAGIQLTYDDANRLFE